jgi:hypothetical protein
MSETTFVRLPLPTKEREAVNDYRRGCPDLPSMREAVNRLFHIGLELNKRKRGAPHDFAAETEGQHEHA